MNPPRVFLFERSDKVNTSDAERFGRRTILFESTHDTRASVLDDNLNREILMRLESHEFDPNRDYFLVVGSLIGVVRMIATAAANYGGCNILIWSQEDYKYLSRSIEEYELDTIKPVPQAATTTSGSDAAISTSSK